MPRTPTTCSCTSPSSTAGGHCATNAHALRGTALTETLLVFIPVWTFFFLSMLVLQYWEGRQIDWSVQMESAFTKQTISGPIFDEGVSQGDAQVRPSDEQRKHSYDRLRDTDPFRDYVFYVEKLEDSNYAGSRDGDDPALPKYLYYVTDRKGRKVVVYRGQNSWSSFIWLRGQNGKFVLPAGSISSDLYKEEERVRSWFKKMGETILDENRPHLMLGS